MQRPARTTPRRRTAICAAIAAATLAPLPAWAQAQDLRRDLAQNDRQREAVRERNAALRLRGAQLEALRAAPANAARAAGTSVIGRIDGEAQRRALALLDRYSNETEPQLRERFARDLVSMLDSGSFRIRRATEGVIERSSLSSQAILAMLRDDTPIEARTGLIDTARRKFADEPRAALGIQIAQDVLPSGMPVPATIASFSGNFPAEREGLLKPGDRIISLAGVPTADPRNGHRALRAAIQANEPGERVRIVVDRPVPPPWAGTDQDAEPEPAEQPGRGFVRPGSPEWWFDPETELQRFELDVTLGSFAALNNTRSDPAAIRAAWNVRLQRLEIERSSAEFTAARPVGPPVLIPLDRSPLTDFTPSAAGGPLDELISSPSVTSARIARWQREQAAGLAGDLGGDVVGRVTLLRRVAGLTERVTQGPSLAPAGAARQLVRAERTLRRLARRAADARAGLGTADDAARADTLDALLLAHIERTLKPARDTAEDTLDRAIDLTP